MNRRTENAHVELCRIFTVPLSDLSLGDAAGRHHAMPEHAVQMMMDLSRREV
jgi:hypothetical protein